MRKPERQRVPRRRRSGRPRFDAEDSRSRAFSFSMSRKIVYVYTAVLQIESRKRARITFHAPPFHPGKKKRIRFDVKKLDCFQHRRYFLARDFVVATLEDEPLKRTNVCTFPYSLRSVISSQRSQAWNSRAI